MVTARRVVPALRRRRFGGLPARFRRGRAWLRHHGAAWGPAWRLAAASFPAARSRGRAAARRYGLVRCGNGGRVPAPACPAAPSWSGRFRGPMVTTLVTSQDEQRA